MKSGAISSLKRGCVRVFAVGFLMGLDAVHVVHSSLKGNARRGALLLLLIVLGCATMTNLTALSRIATDIKMLKTDSVVGVQAAVDLRRLVLTLQLDYLREGESVLTTERLKNFETAFLALHRKYMIGVFEEADDENALRIMLAGQAYVNRLKEVAAAGPDSERDRHEQVDRAFRELQTAVDAGLDYNSQRLRDSAEQAAENAAQAFRISNRIWAIAAGLLVAMMGVVLFDSWWVAKSEVSGGKRSAAGHA